VGRWGSTLIEAGREENGAETEGKAIQRMQINKIKPNKK